MMDAALVINGAVDTVCRNVVSLESLPQVVGAEWVEAGAGVFAGFSYANGEFSPPPSSAPSGAEVNTERDRRIVAGRSFNVAGYGDVPLTGREEDKVALMGLLVKAQGVKAAGITAPVMKLRDGANVNHMLTPDQMIELVSEGMAWIEATMAVSWAMKDGDAPFESGIPADYVNDAYWP